MRRSVKRDLQNAYELATKSANQVHQRNKRNYEKVMRNQVLAKVDRVLLKNLGLKGKHKLQGRWNSMPYVVVEKLPDLPVYKRPVTRIQARSVTHKSHSLRRQDNYSFDEETSESDGDLRPMYKWKSEHDGSRVCVSEGSREKVLPVVDTAEEFEDVSDFAGCEPDVVSET
ncbi:hypothetical protein JOB18_045578 [Solea senegalensis]|uniref:Uncharacterized protein n=1 Tax=Solea senegalensis TaxID=28829 RepID=A0AAV6TB85_SOLSE|nr:hypothetical protein JOB18_034188 [Solea senegalensis]KAG7526825.1 hypothetical protein JOB18_045578 [Solea senegalensis]